MKSMKKTEITLCDNCDGEGTEYVRTYVDGGEYLECKICGGTGRVVKLTTIEVKPYKPKETGKTKN